MLKEALCGAVLAFAVRDVATAQIQQGVRPAIGTATKISVGDVMLEEYRFVGLPGIILHGSISANWGNLERVDLADGTPLAIIRQPI